MRDPVTCEIVASDGYSDNDTKKVDVVVDWSDTVNRLITLTKYFTNGRHHLEAARPEQADSFEIDASGALIAEADKSLVGIVFINTGVTQITIDKITATWDSPNPLITEVWFDDTKYWTKIGQVRLREHAFGCWK